MLEFGFSVFTLSSDLGKVRKELPLDLSREVLSVM